MSYYLRKANGLDKKITFEWANDETARANSFNQEKIEYSSHEKWFEQSLSNPNREMYILMDFMKPLGIVRVDYNSDEEGVISYNLDKDYRGNGLGTLMLSLVEKEVLKSKKKPVLLIGEVKNSNEPSKKAFEKLGYAVDAEEEISTYRKTVDDNNASTYAPEKRPRQANFEMLRVVAMMLVIVTHYLSKGGLIDFEKDTITGNNCGFWVLESLSLVCVNVYVLISGYYLTSSKFKLSKLAYLWCKIFFYSMFIFAVMSIVGLVDIHDYLNLYSLQFFIFPVINGHYWFATAYVVMYLFSPILAMGIKHLSQKQLGLTILLVLIFTCFAKSIIPFTTATDDLGNSFVWFICLFLIAGYIRMYGLKLLDSFWGSLALYILSSLAGLFYRWCAGIIVGQNAGLSRLMTINVNYNFFFVLLASLGLFGMFKNLRIKNNRINNYIVRIAPYTFGVYLLHEHCLIRYEWVKWLRVDESYGVFRIVHLLLSVILILAVGILVDFIVSILFEGCKQLINFALKIYYSKQEAFDYLIFGALATVVSWVVYLGVSRCLLVPFVGDNIELNALISNTISWVAAVIFAYWTNRTFVFRSTVTGFVAVMKEFFSFVLARISSFVVEQILMYSFIHVHMNDIVSKIVVGIVVIIMNYILSKLLIFKNKKMKEEA